MDVQLTVPVEGNAAAGGCQRVVASESREVEDEKRLLVAADQFQGGAETCDCGLLLLLLMMMMLLMLLFVHLADVSMFDLLLVNNVVVLNVFLTNNNINNNNINKK